MANSGYLDPSGWVGNPKEEIFTCAALVSDSGRGVPPDIHLVVKGNVGRIALWQSNLEVKNPTFVDSINDFPIETGNF